MHVKNSCIALAILVCLVSSSAAHAQTDWHDALAKCTDGDVVFDKAARTRMLEVDYPAASNDQRHIILMAIMLSSRNEHRVDYGLNSTSCLNSLTEIVLQESELEDRTRALALATLTLAFDGTGLGLEYEKEWWGERYHVVSKELQVAFIHGLSYSSLNEQRKHHLVSIFRDIETDDAIREAIVNSVSGALGGLRIDVHECIEFFSRLHTSKTCTPKLDGKMLDALSEWVLISNLKTRLKQSGEEE